MSHKHGSICWFECVTTDLPAAKKFYSSLFGWTAEDKPMAADQPGVYTMLKSGGKDVAGMYALAGPMFEGAPSHWVSYICVDSVDLSAKLAADLGGTVKAGPFEIPGVGRMAFLADPTGANIAIFELGQHKGASKDTSPLGWIELHTPDTAAAKAFYSSLFGWQAKEDQDSQYTEFLHAGASIAGMMAIPEDHLEFIPANWLPYAMVDDCDRSLDRALKLGAVTVVPPMDIEKVGRFTVFCDPCGAHLAIIKLCDSPEE